MNDISLHILDIAENSRDAHATLIQITLEFAEDFISAEIADNGRGMSSEILSRVLDPFYTSRTVRDVGLGLPLFKASAERTGGEFEISSREGEGTRVYAKFMTGSIDCPATGNPTDTIVSIFMGLGAADLIYTFKKSTGCFVFDTREFREILGDIPFGDPQIVMFAKEFIDSGTAEI